MNDPAGQVAIEGAISLESNGGFASLLLRPAGRGPPRAWARLRELRGEDKRFKLS